MFHYFKKICLYITSFKKSRYIVAFLFIFKVPQLLPLAFQFEVALALRKQIVEKSSHRINNGSSWRMYISERQSALSELYTYECAQKFELYIGKKQGDINNLEWLPVDDSTIFNEKYWHIVGFIKNWPKLQMRCGNF